MQVKKLNGFWMKFYQLLLNTPYSEIEIILLFPMKKGVFQVKVILSGFHALFITFLYLISSLNQFIQQSILLIAGAN